MIFCRILRRAPRLWWVWLSGVSIAFVIFENVELRDRILAMAHEHGIPADEVYQVDASRRTDRISAYVDAWRFITRKSEVADHAGRGTGGPAARARWPTWRSTSVPMAGASPPSRGRPGMRRRIQQYEIITFHAH